MIRRALTSLALAALALPAAAQTAEALEAQGQAYNQAMSQIYGRSGDPFVFCHEGGEGGAQSQGWYPTDGKGAFVITRYCSGAPCPNWTTLRAYVALCSQQQKTGSWVGPGGPGQAGQYRSSGGSQYRGDARSPASLVPMPH